MSSTSPLQVRKVAILGAGVMGAQIAAQFVNAKVPVLLFELPAREGDVNANAKKAIESLKKLEPNPLASAALAVHIEPANYEHDLERLRECDLIIEAIAERMDFKRSLYEKVVPHVSDDAVFASNTSGLSINALAQALPENLRARFCGVHFFNPPRYMYLVELIPCAQTQPELLDRLEAFLTTTVGKGVVRAKDTPNFIANRVGVFSILAAFHHTQSYKLGFDVVDALTGPLIGRPKSATYRTADVVGLDVLAHVVATMQEQLPNDPWHRYFELPLWYKHLLEQKALGQKSGRGVYEKRGKEIYLLDPDTKERRLAGGEADSRVVEILKLKDAGERLQKLRESSQPHAQFLWAVMRDMLHYCAYHLAEIADNARDLDFAVRWGFGWNQGPFEIWQAAGWGRVAGWIAEDIAAGKAMSTAPLPEWVFDPKRQAVHTPDGSYSPSADTLRPRSTLPVYRRQLFPDRLVGEPAGYGHTVFETDAVRMWHTGDDIGIVSFKSKMHSIGEDVLDGVMQAIDAAERNFKGVLIWQTEPPFSVGANLSGSPSKPKSDSKPSAFTSMMKKVRREAESIVLKAARSLNVADAVMAGRLEKVERVVAHFQATTQAWKYALVPTVSAVDGLALGGGCEFVMHSSRTVATLESYIGLVEAGVGLLPAGGGCKELALRIAADAKGGDPFAFLRQYFQTVALATVSKSAEQARELGYLRPGDCIAMNRAELLFIAKAQVNALADAGYRPPLKARDIPVAGRSALATIKA
ncbi:MAG: 3-hydroxyacyl-CoA dehydrogenase/enoyl-CoA hydratase family protein, partial [Betaproteobacteria bacterium]